MICLKAVSTVYKTKMNIALNTLVESQVANFVFGAQLASLSFGCFNYSVVNNLTMTFAFSLFAVSIGAAENDRFLLVKIPISERSINCILYDFKSSFSLFPSLSFS